MKSFIVSLIACCLLLHLSDTVQAQRLIPADDNRISYMGRISFEHPQSPCFTYPGVQIKARFTGRNISMKMKPGSGYFEIEIDEQKHFKVAVMDQDSIVPLGTNLKEGDHTVCITLVNEGYERRPEFRGFLIDNGAMLLEKPEMPRRRIEFIGNSITCGYGTEGANEKEHWKESTSNYFYSYANILSRALHAQATIVARSGIGMYRNYNGPRKGNRDCMTAMYDQTLFTDSTLRWDYSKEVPDVVIINMGTNDLSTPNYDPDLFKQAYLNFVERVRHNYPKAKIVLLTGCMLQDKPLKMQRRLLDKVLKEEKRSGDSLIYRFDCSPQKGDLGYGSDSHPSKAQHQKMASELLPFIQRITGWQ